MIISLLFLEHWRNAEAKDRGLTTLDGDRNLKTDSGLNDPKIGSGLVIDSVLLADMKEMLSKSHAKLGALQLIGLPGNCYTYLYRFEIYMLCLVLILPVPCERRQYLPELIDRQKCWSSSTTEMVGDWGQAFKDQAGRWWEGASTYGESPRLSCQFKVCSRVNLTEGGAGEEIFWGRTPIPSPKNTDLEPSWKIFKRKALAMPTQQRVEAEVHYARLLYVILFPPDFYFSRFSASNELLENACVLIVEYKLDLLNPESDGATKTQGKTSE